MTKSLKRGFTLIELLVVIAIIGILSGIVLTSLGSARNKAKDSSAQASMASMRAEAELGVNSSGAYVLDICASTVSGGLDKLSDAVNAQVGANAVQCGQDTAVGVQPAAWGAAVTLISGETFCVDSTGYSGASSVAADVEIADGVSSADVVCNNS